MNLTDLSKQLTDIVETASQFVVRVQGRRGYPLSGTIWSETLVVKTSRVTDRGENIKLTLTKGETHEASLLTKCASS